VAEDWRVAHDRALVRDARDLLVEATDRLDAVTVLLTGEPGHRELTRLVSAAQRATAAAAQRATSEAAELNRRGG